MITGYGVAEGASLLRTYGGDVKGKKAIVQGFGNGLSSRFLFG
jgi:glutamate dehydrogenase/leucine dehydrogenase